MAEPTVAPYGSWKSPITSDLIVQGSITLGGVVLKEQDIYWVEGRPAEGGRNVVVVRRASNGHTTDLTPPGFNVRTTVHEYGGGAFTVNRGTVFFSNFADQRVYRQDPGADPRPLTPQADLRYADYIFDERRNRLVCVREDHIVQGEAVNTLVGLDVERGGPGQVLVSGNDFYSSPRISPDGRRLAWLTWNHPNMPWDGTELWVGDITDDGAILTPRLVAGGPRESVFQPEWSPDEDGVLYFISDPTGWWNLYRWRESDGQVEPLYPMDAEFGAPQWQFGMSTYGFASPGEIICRYNRGGISHLARLHLQTGTLEEIATPYSAIATVHVGPGYVVLVAGSPTEPPSLVLLDPASGQIQVLRRSIEVEEDPGYISVPQAIEFPTEGGLTAHAFFYPPQNRDYVAPEGEKPPLLVLSHGGPTGAVYSVLNLGIQYWTSRGFAVVDVNYGGSTGYGREYRERLYGQWGVVDVDDCVNAARYLVGQGLVDPDRLAIRGGSAGGYTTLCALTFRDVFRAGASHFGISDLEVFVRDTHKFESRYLDSLIGPYPEKWQLYYERSPIHFVDRLSAPMILFQGLEDKVVPPNQAEMMFEALRKKGLPVAYVPFEGEQHGFRKAENIKRALDAELYFYSRIFGFELAEPVEPVEIVNLRG